MLHKKSGFTLLEILIALFIFTIVSIILTGALHTALTTQAAVEKKSAYFAKLQITLLMLSRDFEQTINRPIKNKDNQTEGFIGKAHDVTFTHAGWENPLGMLQRATLQRTRYQLNDNSLQRITWPVLDPTSNTPFDTRTLLNDVESIQFEYLDDKSHFQKIWPPSDSQSNPLPRAIRISLILKNWGKISQLYLVPGQPLAQSK